MASGSNTAERWWIYQRERFPVFGHGALIAAFSLSAVCYSSLLRGSDAFPTLRGALVAFVCCFLTFLQLRISDEFKDFRSATYYARALGHWNIGQGKKEGREACIRDCDKALSLSEFIEGYYLRGMAKFNNGDDAVADCIELKKRIDAHTSDPDQQDMLKFARKVIASE